MEPIESIPLEKIERARDRLRGIALRTPLIELPLDGDVPPVFLKLENLQPIGSFKIRGAANAMSELDTSKLADGVYTASAGNMAQGIAFVARTLGVRCRVVVPDHAPATKIEAIERLGGEVVSVPFDHWWQVLMNHGDPELGGHFIHPVSDPDVIAGNGTIGLEILEDLPEVDSVIVPFGGGGLISGIASAVRGWKPNTKVYAAEVETAAPLHASLEAGKPCEVNYEASFVDGIGGKSLLPEMWPLVSRLVDASIVVSLEQVASAIRMLSERARVVVEGAGAAPLAAARTGAASGKIVCVVSGGNIDGNKLSTILRGELP